ncbi:hypothetical protein OQG75_18600, partial [Acinetobacter baumannii]|uniref:hypothetical protein n=3 Tax=Moraxellaceae TaxID=468 RepID=UPI00224306BA
SLFNWSKITNTILQEPVTPKKIRTDFEGNEVSAHRAYTNKWTRIQATVKNVKLDKEGRMYADLTENYIGFKAYISNEDFASSLKPNQKIDMNCFNSTVDSTNNCISYPELVWRNALSKPYLPMLMNSDFISFISFTISRSIPDDSFKIFCSKDIYSANCHNFLIKEIRKNGFFSKGFDKELKKKFEQVCGKNKDIKACEKFKDEIVKIEDLINK